VIDFEMKAVANVATITVAGRQKRFHFFGRLRLYAPFFNPSNVDRGVEGFQFRFL
jgi:hypothetical protein